MKKAITIMLIVLLCFTIASCQPTPKEAIVVSDNDEVFESIVSQATADLQNIDAEDKWQEVVALKNGIMVNVDATLEIPNVSKYPVIKVQPVGFNNEHIRNIVKYLSNGEQMYKFDSNNVFTKESIEKLIIEEKKKLQDVNNRGDKEIMQSIQDAIQALENKYNDAFFESDLKRQAVNVNDISDGMCNITFNTNKPMFATINVSDEREELNRAVFTYHNYGFDGAYTDTHYQEEQPNGVEMKKENAIKLGMDTIKNMGIDYMNVSSVSVSNRYLNSGYSENNSKQCYTIMFSRTYKEVPTPLVQLYAWKQMGIEGGLPENYRNPWTPEYIMMDVDDSGVLSLRWQNPVEIIEEENENVPIINLEETKKLFYENMNLVLSNEEYVENNVEINITRVVLGNQFVPIKDTTDKYRLMPCWVFFGNDSYLGEMSINYPTSELLLNAVDGSMM